MKTFNDICRMSQQEVKNYMQQYLASKQYKVIDEDGFLYAEGDVPVLLVAHMDTVHKSKPTEISELNGKITSPQGIGGDDRCGVFIIANIIKDLHCSVLLCEDEEIGGVGAKKFAETKYIEKLDVNYMIEFDRKGNNDAVFYSCDNKEFTEFVTKNTGFKLAYGTYSDISTLMPISKLCAVNLSSGYYNPHTTSEYVMYDEMMNTIEAAKKLIKTPCGKSFEYKAKTYTNTYNYNPWSHTEYKDSYSQPSIYDEYDVARRAKTDIELELEVVYVNIKGVEDTIYVTGDTKYECWLKLFTDNPDLCFNDIIDYSFS
jgi:acetylornithine deacetylase/succinyl-diaminopimelate desuccinylase-like protein